MNRDICIDLCQMCYVQLLFYVHSVAVLAAWDWLASCLIVSPAWCSAAFQPLWPVPLGYLAGVFRMSPACQCQVRPGARKEGGRKRRPKPPD